MWANNVIISLILGAGHYDLQQSIQQKKTQMFIQKEYADVHVYIYTYVNGSGPRLFKFTYKIKYCFLSRFLLKKMENNIVNL
jgi:hypothetical protein